MSIRLFGTTADGFACRPLDLPRVVTAGSLPPAAVDAPVRKAKAGYVDERGETALDPWSRRRFETEVRHAPWIDAHAAGSSLRVRLFIPPAAGWPRPPEGGRLVLGRPVLTSQVPAPEPPPEPALWQIGLVVLLFPPALAVDIATFPLVLMVMPLQK